MALPISIDRNQIAEFCRRYGVVEFALFGSVLREDFGPNSDVDALVRFAPDAHPTLFTLARMENELSRLFNRRVDLVDKQSIEESRNPYRRKAILDSCEILHAA